MLQRSEILQWLAIGAAILIGAVTLFQAAQFRSADIGEKVVVIEERLKGFDFRGIQQELQLYRAEIEAVKSEELEGHAARLKVIEGRISEISKELKLAMKGVSFGEKVPTAEDVAKVLATQYAEVLRGVPGPQGVAGLRGAAGLQGTDGKPATIDYDHIIEEVTGNLKGSLARIIHERLPMRIGHTALAA